MTQGTPLGEIPQDVATCRVCGCTDDRACAGGCVWVEDPEELGDLCSACAPDNRPIGATT